MLQEECSIELDLFVIYQTLNISVHMERQYQPTMVHKEYQIFAKSKLCNNYWICDATYVYTDVKVSQVLTSTFLIHFTKESKASSFDILSLAIQNCH